MGLEILELKSEPGFVLLDPLDGQVFGPVFAAPREHVIEFLDQQIDYIKTFKESNDGDLIYTLWKSFVEEKQRQKTKIVTTSERPYDDA